MKNTMPQEDFKLEFYFNEEGLFISGNSMGLNGLAEELRKAAQSATGYHRHLSFSWREKQKTGKLNVNFGWIKKFLRSDKGDIEDFDVTIMKTEKIGKELWGKGVS